MQEFRGGPWEPITTAVMFRFMTGFETSRAIPLAELRKLSKVGAVRRLWRHESVDRIRPASHGSYE